MPLPLLAIETCLGPLSVAVVRSEDGQLLAHRDEPAGAANAELLMPAVRDAMAQAGFSFSELSRTAITLGPGSFTGVRTGIAAARGFALGTNIEVVGISSLALIARMAACEAREDAAPLLAAMDARRGRIYAQVFRAPDFAPMSEPQDVTADEAFRLGTRHGVRLVAGSGAQFVVDRANRDVEMRVADFSQAPAVFLARLARSLAPLHDIAPIYIRPPDAKPPSGHMIARIT